MFSAGYKPDAVSHNIASEDTDHFLKHGTFLHGEAFHRGVRLPGGNRDNPLPEGFIEGSEHPVVPLMPGLTDTLEVHDGCAGQYAGKTNFHQTAEWLVKTRAWPEVAAAQAASDEASARVAAARMALRPPDEITVLETVAKAVLETAVEAATGVFRGQLRLETMRGKGGCDGASNLVPSTVHNGLLNEELLDPSTRELVIFMARRKQEPSISGLKKQGWWAADEYIYVWYDTRVFTASRVPPAEGFDGSSQIHSFYGRSEANEAARIDGPLLTRGVFCACAPCRTYNFTPGACLMRSEYGTHKLEYARRSVARDASTTRMGALQDYANRLKSGQVQAIAASRNDRHMEGNIWLLLLLSAAYVSTEVDLVRCMHSNL